MFDSGRDLLGNGGEEGSGSCSQFCRAGPYVHGLQSLQEATTGGVCRSVHKTAGEEPVRPSMRTKVVVLEPLHAATVFPAL